MITSPKVLIFLNFVKILLIILMVIYILSIDSPRRSGHNRSLPKISGKPSTCDNRILDVAPSWNNTPIEPRIWTGASSFIYMGQRPELRPQFSPIMNRPSMIISNELTGDERPINRPPNIPRILFSKRLFFLNYKYPIVNYIHLSI